MNELKNSAQFAEDKLDIIEGKAEDLLQSSHHIHESLASIDAQTEHVAKMLKNTSILFCNIQKQFTSSLRKLQVLSQNLKKAKSR